MHTYIIYAYHFNYYASVSRTFETSTYIFDIGPIVVFSFMPQVSVIPIHYIIHIDMKIKGKFKS